MREDQIKAEGQVECSKQASDRSPGPLNQGSAIMNLEQKRIAALRA